VLSLFSGGIFGVYFPSLALSLKPLGDIFLNLILTTIVPLIFFSVSAAIARAGSQNKLGKIASSMVLVFLGMSLIAATLMLITVKLFSPAAGVFLQLPNMPAETLGNVSSQLVSIFTVTNFSELLNHQHMLALIVFSILIGVACATREEADKQFLNFLESGQVIFMRVFNLIMYYAPIGFFAYFAVLVSELGPKLLHTYLNVTIIYYSFAVLYFVIFYTFYAYLAGKYKGIKLFWQHVFLPLVTSIATCSSAASIPANLSATSCMGVSKPVAETVIPLGSLLHKDGSVIGGVVKIAFLFGIFNIPFTGADVLLTAIGIALLVGTVMGAIPSGGMLGELLILNVYGFPPSALIAIAAISIIIDPIATALNVVGNTVGAMMIARQVEGRRWHECI
jgi:Na+/H+-dicarboxylate symporter